MVRKQILLTEAQNDYLRTLAEATGESEGHFIRQALELHAEQLNPSAIPGLVYEEKPPTTKGKTDESKS